MNSEESRKIILEYLKQEGFKNNNGLIEDLRKKYEEENNSLLKQNLKMVLDYYDGLEEAKSL